MTMFFSVCCFAIAFTPALMLFKRVVMSDPLRIILFVLGAFFWLLSLLVTSLVWAVTGNYSLLIAVLSSILVQELFRGLYYYLLYKAQGGLSKLATDGVEVSGVRLMYSSRHVLAIVCGLGMGVMAALVLLTNILADYADDGVVGLPAEMNQTDPGHHSQEESQPQQQLRFEDAYFPLYYSLSCALLTLFNVVWTINLWDGLHKVFHKYDGLWYVTVALTLLYHWVNTILSIWLRHSPIPILCAQAAILLLTGLHSALLIKNVTGWADVRAFFRRNQPPTMTTAERNRTE